MKKPHAQELSRNKPILHFDVILQHNWPIEQCLLHIKVFFGGKKKRPWSDLFIHWLIKQITNTYQNHFSRSYEIRSKGYMRMKKFSQACFSLFPRFMHSIVHWIKVIATPILVDEIYILIALSYDDWEYVQLVI